MRTSPVWLVAFLLVALTGGCGQGRDKTGPAEAEKPQIDPPQYPPGVDRTISLDLGDGVTMELALIPAGEFMMGSHESPEAVTKAFGLPEEAVAFLKREHPQHRVKITKACYMGRYEVTQEQWQAIMGSNPSRFKGARNPADSVSWNDCQAFLTRLNEKLANTSMKFSLPTEVQWEYACRAGTTSRYSFADDKASLEEYAWHRGNSGRKTHAVGQKEPNAWGLYDMHGNLWEWCQDWYESDYYGKSPTDDPTGPTAGSQRVIRGGSWNLSPWSCRSADRDGNEPDTRGSALGFRVVSGPVDAINK